MQSIYRVLTLCALLGCQVAANANDWFLGVGVGGGDVEFDPSTFPDLDLLPSTASSDNVLVGELLAGYELASGVFVDASFEQYDSLNLFGAGDEIDFDTLRFGVGYVTDTQKKFGLTAKAGLAFWRLKVGESVFLNPGPENRGKRDGSDVFIQVGGELRIAKSLRAGLVFDFSDTGFGDTSAVKLMVRFFP